MSQSNKSLDVNETLVSTEAFLIKNKQKLIMALVAVAVVFGAFFGVATILIARMKKDKQL